jgi:DNA-binding LytR/AlgR family response regulator
MKSLIIEDEILAAERIHLLLKQYHPSFEAVAVIDSVEESVKWLRTNAAPDFILMDIQLADGSAFEIFKQIKISSPVIFTTAFDRYALEAFNVLSIDYLLKPVTIQALTRAIDKLKILQHRTDIPSIDYVKLVQMISERPLFKSRFTGRFGTKIQFINTDQISFFEAENKIVYLATMDGSRFLIDQTLEQVETLVDPKLFFRVSRSFIIHIAAIIQVKPYTNSRLVVLLKSGTKTDEVIVSRERVHHFKSWADS